MPEHKVIQGDCIGSIAAKHGLLIDAIWDHAKNATLREKRRNNEYALLPGDILFVPERRIRQENASTGLRHKFAMARPKMLLRIRLEDVHGKPRIGQHYTLVIDGDPISGTTNANGEVKQPIAAGARAGVLILNPGKGADEEAYELHLGHLDPVDEPTGLQARLQNLGFYDGAIDGDVGNLTKEAIATYQRAFNLEETGEVNAATIGHLERKHGN